MKGYFLQLLFVGAISNFAMAQDGKYSEGYLKDPQVNEGNYKHPNKAAAAIKSGKSNHFKSTKVEVKDNSNYKQSFTETITTKSKVETSPLPKKGEKDTRNYKHQF